MSKKTMLVLCLGAIVAFGATANASMVLTFSNASMVTNPASVTIGSDATSYYLANGAVTSGTQFNTAGITTYGGYSQGQTGAAQFTANGGTAGPAVTYPGGTSTTLMYNGGSSGGNGYGNNGIYIPLAVGTTAERVHVVFGYATGSPTSEGAYFTVGGQSVAGIGALAGSSSWKFAEYNFDVVSTSAGTANVSLAHMTAYGDWAVSTITAAWVTPAPEPATMALLVLGGIGAMLRRRRTA